MTLALSDTDLRAHRIVASISGGKDSAALSLYLKERGIEHDRVFMDTGWEHDATYEYLRGELTRVIGPITEIQSAQGGLEDIIRKRGMFPSRVRRFCTQEAKVFPMRDHIAKLQDAGDECINAVGIRAAESEARSKMPEWEQSDTFDCLVWRPLIRWTEADVIAIHKRHGLKPNPLYLMGATRVGCWPCIFARKAEIRLIADKDPARISRLRVLEAEVGVAAEMRYHRDLPGRLEEHARVDAEWVAKHGDVPSIPVECVDGDECSMAGDETHQHLLLRPAPPRPYSPPSWFQSRLTAEGGLCWPIDKVVDWSKTSHGGMQYDMFAADPADAGCMRWGMCDTNGDPEPPDPPDDPLLCIFCGRTDGTHSPDPKTGAACPLETKPRVP